MIAIEGGIMADNIYVDFAGIESINEELTAEKKGFDAEMSTLAEIVSGTDEDWQGADASLFVSTTTSKLNKLKEEYVEYLELVQEILTTDADNFNATLQANISMIEN